jgi:hypothetical protein
MRGLRMSAAWYAGTSLDGRSVQALNIDSGPYAGRRITVARHGEGRKYWGVTYPDGTYTHDARTQAEAKLQAEAWSPDASLVPLLEAGSGDADAMPAAELAASGAADWTAAAVVSAFVDAASRRDFEKTRKGWGYQDAGKQQQRALLVLRELAALRIEVGKAIDEQVAAARLNTGGAWYSNAATWADVGAALGVTKQSVQAKYGRST